MDNIKNIENTMELKVVALPQNGPFVRNTVTAFALQLNPSLSEISDLKTAVEEAFVNIAIHAYPNSIGYATIKAKIINHSIEVIVSDEGIGIEDLEQAQAPFYTSKPDGERSGMGFTIMQTFMSDFEVKNADNGKGLIVRMLKEFESSNTL